jgi:hypothetical protein
MAMPVGESSIRKTITTRYNVAEHLRLPEEMATCLEVCLEETEGAISDYQLLNICIPSSVKMPPARQMGSPMNGNQEKRSDQTP